jgi:CHAT domain-containing protein
MAVGQASTRGLAPLPGTIAELDRIAEFSRNIQFTRLDGDQATPTAVFAGMEQHSWVHFACHASQNITEPTKSAFHLHGGSLDLATITQKPLEHATLAFLSACQTATGDETLSEEAVHLAAGMIMAGYPSVIATTWSISDEDAPLIAEKVYTCMLEEGVPDSRKAAKALHHAVECLRAKVGVKEFVRWVPYIHIGQ